MDLTVATDAESPEEEVKGTVKEAKRAQVWAPGDMVQTSVSGQLLSLDLP